MSSYRSPHVPYVYITPAALVTIVALLYPIVEAIKIGFFEWGMGTPWETARWVGLEAFGAAMVDEQVWVSVGITLAFVFLAITVEMVLGVGLALLLESPVRGMRLFRTAFVLPMMVAPICVGLIWRYMLDAQFGPINHLMSALGLPPQEWLASPWLAFGAMVVTDVWQWTAFVFIMVLAALQGVEASVTEASRIDGASWWQQIWMVKLPIIRPLLIVTLLSLVVVVIYAFRANLSHLFITLGLFVGSLVFLPTTDYIFNSILKEHQQNRILSFLGIINDPQGVDYNVNQSKIAIGSGGFWGKGFLEGTQIKYGFVPERHTDFIFCTVGEEWGFVGSVVVLTLLCMLILRLMRMGERQQEPFGRVYCYSVASILLFHVFVNVGMTVGLMPVMGIPLPFMSYGGSSLIAFTILLFIAVRLDASTRQFGLNKF